AHDPPARLAGDPAVARRDHRDAVARHLDRLAIRLDGGGHLGIVQQQHVFVQLALALEHRAGLDFRIADNEILPARVPVALALASLPRLTVIEPAVAGGAERGDRAGATAGGGQARARIVG